MKASELIMKIGDTFSNPITLANTDAPDQPLIYVNKLFKKLTGYQNDQLIGHNCRLLQGEKTDREAVARIKNAINSGSPICQDLLNYTANGEIFFNRLVLVPFKEKGAQYFVGLQNEITAKQFRPIHHIDKLDILDKTMNPVTIMLGMFLHPELDERDLEAVT